MHIVPIGLTHKGGFQKLWSFNIKLVFSFLVVLFLDITNLVLGLALGTLTGCDDTLLSLIAPWWLQTVFPHFSSASVL